MPLLLVVRQGKSLDDLSLHFLEAMCGHARPLHVLLNLDKDLYSLGIIMKMHTCYALMPSIVLCNNCRVSTSPLLCFILYAYNFLYNYIYTYTCIYEYLPVMTVV